MPSTVSSLVTLYLGAVTIALLASGSLGDRYGQRRGLPHRRGRVRVVVAARRGRADRSRCSPPSRVLQALSGALVSTTSIALVRALSPADRRGAAFGLFDMLVSTSAAIGPFIGGLLVGAFGWRSLFVHRRAGRRCSPRSVGSAMRRRRRHRAATCRRPNGVRDRAPPSTARRRPGIDVAGLSSLLAAILIAILVAIRGAGDGGAGRPRRDRGGPIPLLVALRPVRARRPSGPAVDPRLFASRPFTAAVLGVLGTTVVLHAAFILVPLLVERLQGGTAETAGLVLLGISGHGRDRRAVRRPPVRPAGPAPAGRRRARSA